MKYLMISVVPAVATLLFAGQAHAARNPDLDVSISAPSGLHVYENGTFDVVVSNIGNKNAKGVTLTIDLPKTNTSPTIHILGDLGTFSSSCSLSNQTLVCSLGRVRRNRSKTVSFDIALPLSSAAINVDASAVTTTNEPNTGNNNDTYVANLLLYPYTIPATATATNRHCTGQGLTSFFECELYPSSISAFDAVFEQGGSMTFVNQPGYTGSWAQPTTEQLQYDILFQGNVVASFDGYGVGGDCFEGITTFPNSQYLSPYEVCF